MVLTPEQRQARSEAMKKLWKTKRAKMIRGVKLGAARRYGKVSRRANGFHAPGSAVKDATLYLRHAQEEIMRQVREGRIKKPDPAHLLALLALQELEKDQPT